MCRIVMRHTGHPVAHPHRRLINIVVALSVLTSGRGPHDNQTLLHFCKLWEMPGKTLDHDRARHSAFTHLIRGFTMDVHVIPVESRLLIVGNVHDVMQLLARLCKHAKHVVTIASRRHRQSVKMEIRVGADSLVRRKIVGEVDLERLAGRDLNRRSDALLMLVHKSGQEGGRVDIGSDRKLGNAMHRTYDRRFGELVYARIGRWDGQSRRSRRNRIGRAAGAAAATRKPSKGDEQRDETSSHEGTPPFKAVG